MKKLFKIFGIVVLSLFLIIVALIIAASFSQNKIAGITLKKISESVNAPIEVEHVSFTLIKRFPYATIELSGIRIGAENQENSTSQSPAKKDILKIKRAFILLKSIPFLRGEYEIYDIEMDDVLVNYHIDSLGRSNIGFLLNTPEPDSVSIDSAENLPDINLKKVKLKNTLIIYSDDSLKMAANLVFPSLELKGNLTNEKIAGTAKGDVRISDLKFGATPVNRMEEVAVSFNLDYHSDTLNIRLLEAKTEGINLDIRGKATFSVNSFADLVVELKNLELEKVQKFIPEELLKEYGIEEFTGNIMLSGSVKGIVSDSLLPALNFKMNLENGRVKTKQYPLLKKIKFEVEITNGNLQNRQTSSLSFKSFHAETGKSKADFVLKLYDLEKPKYEIQAKLKIDISDFKSFIPDSLIKNISGGILATVSTKGQIPDSIDDKFINLLVNNTSAKADFSNFTIETDSLQISDLSGSMIYSPKQLSATDLNVGIPDFNLQLKNTSFTSEFDGQITQPNELAIRLKSFYTESPQGSIHGSATIQNLNYPEFSVNARAKINLAELKPFLHDTLIKSLSGTLDAEIITNGKMDLDSISEQMSDILFKQSSLQVIAGDISLSMPDTLQEITGLNGLGKLENGTITILKTSGVAAGVDFTIDSARVSNVYETVVKNRKETLKAYLNLGLGTIDYSKLTPLFNATALTEINNADNSRDSLTVDFSNTEVEVENEKRNYLFEIKGKVSAKSYRQDKIFLEDISAKFNLTDSVYIVDQFITKAFDGYANSSLRYSLTGNDKQIINVKNRIDNMDIHKLLFAFDDFGYDSLISYKNITGIISAELNSRFVFVADTLVSNDIRVLGNFKLKNGKLINYEPAMDVSKFTGIKELDNIDMKTLECNIFMFKNKIYMPITKIVSSSMDLSTFGMQSMSDDYEYHIQMKLSEILKGKSQKLFERQIKSGDEISEDDIDKNTIKLIYGYIDGKKKVGFATKKAQRQMALKIQVQQKMLELIFHPKLVSFETGVN